MALGTPTLLAGGNSSSASVACSFSSPPAGAELFLVVSADDYKTGDPSGWTLEESGQDFLGFYVWRKTATGSETSVTYTIGSAVSSAWAVGYVTGAEATLDASPAATHTHGGSSTSSSTATWTTGNRVAVALLGAMHSTNQITGAGSWTNSYTEFIDQIGPASGAREIVAAAYLALSGGGGTTSSNATWEGTSCLCSYGVTLVFKEAAPVGPPVVRPNVADALTGYRRARRRH